jgi:hypothetical protein
LIYPHEELLLTDEEQTIVHIGFQAVSQEDQESLDSSNSIDVIFFSKAKIVGD